MALIPPHKHLSLTLKSTISAEVEAFLAGEAGEKLIRRAQRELGWSDGVSRRVLEEYKKFLTIKYTLDRHGTKLSAPCAIDQLWELHILDTRAYAQFNGSTLHRDPDQDTDTSKHLLRRVATKAAVAKRFACDPDIWSLDDNSLLLVNHDAPSSTHESHRGQAGVRC